MIGNQLIDNLFYYIKAALQYFNKLILLHRAKGFIQYKDDGCLVLGKYRIYSVYRELYRAELVYPSQFFAVILRLFFQLRLKVNDNLVESIW